MEWACALMGMDMCRDYVPQSKNVEESEYVEHEIYDVCSAKLSRRSRPPLLQRVCATSQLCS